MLDFAAVWFQHTDRIIFHDPLAGATIFDPSICTFTPGDVEIELTSEQEGGQTIWRPNGERHEVALTVQPERFFEHYFNVFFS